MQKLTHATTQIVRDDILAHNVRAVTEITNVLATSLGPQSMSKMLVDPFGGIIITNDGSRILQEMQIIHPAAKLLVQMAIKQDANVGDGTTSVVLVCGELLRQCQAYLQKKSVHRNVLSLKLQQTCKRACKMIDTLCENETDRKESLQKLVTTSLATKYISKYNENGILSKLVIQTITYIYNFAERNSIDVEKDLKVVKLSHPSVQQSLVLRGGCVIRVRNVNVLPVESKLEKVNVSICTIDIGPFLFVKDTVIRDPKQFHELEELVMKSYWTQIVQPLKSKNVKVLISSRSVDRRCISLLNDNNIFVFELEDTNLLDSTTGIDNDIEFLQQCCKVKNTISNVKDFHHVGTVELIQLFEKGSRLHIHNHNSCHLATLVLRAPTQEILKELDIALHDGLSLCIHVLRQGQVKIVPGGGVVETKLAELIESEQDDISTLLASALRIIPFTLSKNSSRSLDEQQGLVFDSKSAKESIITLATEMTCAILKLDCIVIEQMKQRYLK